MSALNCIVMGSAARDLHEFRQFFAHRPEFRVRCFISREAEHRVWVSRDLLGENCTHDLPSYPEAELSDLIAKYQIDFVFLADSGLTHEEVMHRASLVQATGASFGLLGPIHSERPVRRPVISVTGTRTGVGKSSVTLAIARHLRASGSKVVVLGHPKGAVGLEGRERLSLSSARDLERPDLTREEQEEYAPLLEIGVPVHVGLDEDRMVALAESDADVIVWDGADNDTPFLRSDLHIVVVDALRPQDVSGSYPAETNFRRADVVVITKIDQSGPGAVEEIRAAVEEHNQSAMVAEADLEIDVEGPERIVGRRVLVLEDGRTLTHGGLAFGAGYLAARRFDAREIIDPRPFAIGSLRDRFASSPQIGPVLPVIFTSGSDAEDLARTIAAAKPDLIIDATQSELGAEVDAGVPCVHVGYYFRQTRGPALVDLVDRFLAEQRITAS